MPKDRLAELLDEIHKTHADASIRDLDSIRYLIVWHRTSDRYPAISLIDHPGEGFCWGHNWEYQAGPELPVSEVAQDVLRTLPEQSAVLNGNGLVA